MLARYYIYTFHDSPLIIFMRLLYVLRACVIAGLFRCISPSDNKFAGQDCKPVEELHFTPDTSVIDAQVVISQKLIEDKINASLKQDLVRDTDFYNINKFTGKEDHTKMIVRRLGKVQISWNNANVTCSAPVAVNVERQIIDQKLFRKGLVLNLDFQARVTFDIAVNIDPDWRLSARSKFRNLEWISEPVMEKSGINLKKQVEKVLIRKMPEVEYSLNQQIHNKVTLQPAMERIWQKLQKPIALSKQERMLWIQFRPLSVSLASIRSTEQDLLLGTRVVTFLQTLVGKNPVFEIDSTLPPLQRTEKRKTGASLHLVAELPFQEINQVLAEKLTGQNIQAQGQELTVKSAKLSNCGDLLIARVKVGGDVSGEVTFCGVPEFRYDSMKLCVGRFDFATNTESLLVGGADLVAHDMLQAEIQQYLSIGLADEIARLPDLITAGIENSKVGQTMNLSISNWDMRPQKIYVQEDRLTILIAASAELRLVLERV